MSEEIAAVCSKCNKSTTGKIYDPYWCADCKIKDLKVKANAYNNNYVYEKERRKEWYEKFHDERREKVKYKGAFEALYEKISSKR